MLATSEYEKDIGVVIDKTLKTFRQCAIAAKKANQVLGQVSCSFHFRDRHTFPKLYVQFVRCQLESSVVVRNPWTNPDISTLEKVQIRAVNLVSRLSGRSYEVKLTELHLQSLYEKRVVHFDMVQTFNILISLDNVDYRTWFETMAG